MKLFFIIAIKIDYNMQHAEQYYIVYMFNNMQYIYIYIYIYFDIYVLYTINVLHCC